MAIEIKRAFDTLTESMRERTAALSDESSRLFRQGKDDEGGQRLEEARRIAAQIMVVNKLQADVTSGLRDAGVEQLSVASAEAAPTDIHPPTQQTSEAAVLEPVRLAPVKLRDSTDRRTARRTARRVEPRQLRLLSQEERLVMVMGADGDKTVRPSPLEWKLLVCLAKDRRWRRAGELVEHVWGVRKPPSNLRSLLASLRDKLGGSPKDQRIIRSGTRERRGQYKLSATLDESSPPQEKISRLKFTPDETYILAFVLSQPEIQDQLTRLGIPLAPKVRESIDKYLHDNNWSKQSRSSVSWMVGNLNGKLKGLFADPRGVAYENWGADMVTWLNLLGTAHSLTKSQKEGLLRSVRKIGKGVSNLRLSEPS